MKFSTSFYKNVNQFETEKSLEYEWVEMWDKNFHFKKWCYSKKINDVNATSYQRYA